MEPSLSQHVKADLLDLGPGDGASKNSISVQSTGEVNTLPDVVQFTVTVRSAKETAEEAQASVKRRTDYVSQVIRKNGVSDFDISTEISKGNGGGFPGSSQMEEMVTVCTDVDVKCDSLLKCETIRNLLVEKMDSSVHFSSVNFWLSAEAKQTGRQEAFKKAVTSAKSKAECISLTVGVQLGSAIQVKELAQDSGPTLKEDKDAEMDPQLPPVSLHQRQMNASWTFSSRVFVCFETQPTHVHMRSHSKQY